MVRILFISALTLILFSTSKTDAFFWFGEWTSTSREPQVRQEIKRPITFQQKVRPPKQAIIEEHKRRALYIVQWHRTNIVGIQSRITNIVTFLEKASIDTLGLPTLVVQLENQIIILERLEDEIQHKRVSKDKLRNTLHKQRQTMKWIMHELRTELKSILNSIKS